MPDLRGHPADLRARQDLQVHRGHPVRQGLAAHPGRPGHRPGHQVHQVCPDAVAGPADGRTAVARAGRADVEEW